MKNLLRSWNVGLIALVFMSVTSSTSFAINYDVAVVDGNTGEWSEGDFYATMHRAGNPDKVVESNLYLRYDCDSQILYALVVTVDNVVALQSDGDAYIKYKNNESDNASTKGVGGGFPSFAWVYEGGELIGWEGSFQIAPGSYFINAHVQVWDDNASQTSATTAGSSNNRFIPITISCDNVEPREPEGPVFYSISGSIFHDENVSADWDADENDVFAGWNVTLTDADGNVIATTVTDENGFYVFDELLEGTYKVNLATKVSQIEDGVLVEYKATSYSVYTVVGLSEDVTIDFGYAPVYDIAGSVFLDSNSSSEFDAYEPTFSGVEVSLIDSDGNPIATVVSDEEGNYFFEDLWSGDYKVVVGDLSSDVADFFNSTTAESYDITLNANSTDNDFGYATDVQKVFDSITTGTGKTIGFWKHQLQTAIKGKGKAQVSASDVQSYLDSIEAFFLAEPFQFDDSDEFSDAFAVLSSTSSDPIDLLKKQLLGTEFNHSASWGLVDNLALQEVLLQWGESLVASNCQDANLVLTAKDIFDEINNTGE